MRGVNGVIRDPEEHAEKAPKGRLCHPFGGTKVPKCLRPRLGARLEVDNSKKLQKR